MQGKGTLKEAVQNRLQRDVVMQFNDKISFDSHLRGNLIRKWPTWHIFKQVLGVLWQEGKVCKWKIWALFVCMGNYCVAFHRGFFEPLNNQQLETEKLLKYSLFENVKKPLQQHIYLNCSLFITAGHTNFCSDHCVDTFKL